MGIGGSSSRPFLSWSGTRELRTRRHPEQLHLFARFARFIDFASLSQPSVRNRRLSRCRSKKNLKAKAKNLVPTGSCGVVNNTKRIDVVVLKNVSSTFLIWCSVMSYGGFIMSCSQ